ncbi:hypothetical protein [Ideonella livida]|uniref:Uracil-DNA glycosylase n=1 Tax=Ideonella livida TaxID=2707176 RepID=A0A7C9THB4_9BURK|nr:hypothetical protein [Ideonella livida]NDY90441.1 hypothetical protein [Ideonella livida]
MTALLIDQLRGHLEGWQEDLPPAWVPVLKDVELNWAGVSPTRKASEHPVIPQRRGQVASGRPAGSHLFKALDEVPPHQVRAVMIGQDPYPHPKLATGRSFEPGDQTTWSPQTPKSLQRIAQMLAVHRDGQSTDPPLGDAHWATWCERFNKGRLPPPPALFAHWAGQGVLCLNLALTHTKFEGPEQDQHMALWQPVLQAVVRHLAGRESPRPLLVMPWSGKVRNALAPLDLALPRALCLPGHHPNARGSGDKPLFFDQPNPFSTANQALADAHGQALNW